MTYCTDAANAWTSARERIKFNLPHPKSERWFAYHDGTAFDYLGVMGRTLTTWTGDPLARVTRTYPAFHSNFGDRRQNFEARDSRGRRWYGTAYLSAGQYVRIRLAD